jgi:hypothetical protein
MTIQPLAGGLKALCVAEASNAAAVFLGWGNSLFTGLDGNRASPRAVKPR